MMRSEHSQPEQNHQAEMDNQADKPRRRRSDEFAERISRGIILGQREPVDDRAEPAIGPPKRAETADGGVAAGAQTSGQRLLGSAVAAAARRLLRVRRQRRREAALRPYEIAACRWLRIEIWDRET